MAAPSGRRADPATQWGMAANMQGIMGTADPTTTTQHQGSEANERRHTRRSRSQTREHGDASTSPAGSRHTSSRAVLTRPVSVSGTTSGVSSDSGQMASGSGDRATSLPARQVPMAGNGGGSKKCYFESFGAEAARACVVVPDQVHVSTFVTEVLTLLVRWSVEYDMVWPQWGQERDDIMSSVSWLIHHGGVRVTRRTHSAKVGDVVQWTVSEVTAPHHTVRALWAT